MSKKKQRKEVSNLPQGDSAVGRNFSSRVTVMADGPVVPELDLRFFSWSLVGTVLLAFIANIITLNGALVLNDRSNLAFIYQAKDLNTVSNQLLLDALSRPLSQPWAKMSLLSDRLDYGGTDMWYHGVNLFFHMFASLYLFLFVFRLARHFYNSKRLALNPYYLALAAGVIFACHPLMTGTVAYVSARSALLGAVNFLFAANLFLLGYFLRNPGWKAVSYGLAVVAGVMAIWSNSQTILLPAFLCFLALTLSDDLKNWTRTLISKPILFGTLIPLAIGAPLLLLTGVGPLAAINFGMPIPSQTVYYATQLKAFLTYYLRCTFMPAGLSVDPPFATAGSFADPLVWVGSLVICGLLIWLSRTRCPLTWVGAGLVISGLLPHMLVPQPDFVADWVMYLPLSGISLLFAMGFYKLYEKKGELMAGGALAALVAIYLVLSIWRNTQWATDNGLWTAALNLNQNSARANAMLAFDAMRKGKLEDARRYAGDAVTYGGDQVISWIAEGQSLLLTRSFVEAEHAFGRAEEMCEKQGLSKSLLLESRLGLAEAYLWDGKAAIAQTLLQKIAPDATGNSRLIYLLSLLSYKNGDYQQALQLAAVGLERDPSLLQAMEIASMASMHLGLYQQALLAAEALRRNLDSASAKLLAARALLAQAKVKEGLPLLTDLLKSDPKDARVKLVLSRFYAATGEAAKAKTFFKEAIALDPQVMQSYALPEFMPALGGKK